MKQTPFRCLCLLLILLGAVHSRLSAHTDKTREDVLFLNSINFNLPWAKDVFWYTHQALQKEEYLRKGRVPFGARFVKP